MIYQEKLENGLRIAAEQLASDTVTLGLFVGCGSANENSRSNGMSHFIEHMCFKGTARRSYKDIAWEMDGVGGQINAVTTREYTCYYAKVRKEHMDLALDIIVDQALGSLMQEETIAREKQVVLEEIAMLQDTPEDLVYDNLYKAHFSGSSLAMPIAGRMDTVRKFDRQSILNFFQAFYRMDNMVLSAVGGMDIARLKDMVLERVNEYVLSPRPQPRKGSVSSQPVVFKEHPCDQAHLCLGFPGVRRGAAQRYPIAVLNSIVGGGLSSRLFQKVREEAGLAYSVYSDTTHYTADGIFSLYAGVNASNIIKCMQVIRAELEDVLCGGITAQEVDRAKEQIKGNYILERDSMSGRMSALGAGTLLSGRIRTPEQILAAVDGVTLEDVHAAAAQVFKFDKLSASFVGVGQPLEQAADMAWEWRNNG